MKVESVEVDPLSTKQLAYVWRGVLPVNENGSEDYIKSGQWLGIQPYKLYKSTDYTPVLPYDNTVNKNVYKFTPPSAPPEQS